MTSIEWLAFFVLLVSAVGAAAVVTLSNGAVVQAIRCMERAYRRQKSLELEQVQAQAVAQRQVEVEETLSRSNGWQTVIDQLLADALPETGARVGAEGVLDLSTAPAPRFTVAGADGHNFLFTTSPEALRRVGLLSRKAQAIPLDAALHAAARVEAQGVWEHLAAQRLRGQETPVLPRQAAWCLVVREAAPRRETAAR